MKVRLSSLFALTLTLSILCNAYLPSHAQTAATTPREVLVEEIEADIARRIEAGGDLLNPEQIKELYLVDAEAAGLTYRELVELYEQEYVDQKAAQKPSPWQQFQPGVGWLVGIVSLSILTWTKLLGQWIETHFKKIGDWIYRQGAGTRLFRNIALRKYRAALKENNETLPMPFLKNHAPLKMEDVYVPLKVSEAKQQQIDAYQAITNHRRLMVIGEPGSGKSVLLKYIAWAYGSDKLTALEEHPVVVLLELYRLSDPELNEAKLTQAIVAALGRNNFPNAHNFVRSGLENGIFLFLLDGLDEVNSSVRPHVVGVIRDLLKGKWKQCRVVITCRTAVYNDEFSDIAERKLEVIEFTDQQMRQFLKAWEPEMVRARKSINQMMAALRERPLILKLARNPLLLTLIAYLYTEPAFVLPRSRAEFYEKSTGILLEQREYKGDDEYKHNRYEPSEKRRVLRHLALYAQDHSAELQDRRSLAADVVREQIKTVLPSLDIPVNEAKDMLEEIADRSGLFSEIDGGDRYLFPHLTLQEYFAATALKDQETELIQRFTTDPKAWREVVKLWCSLANESTAFVRAIYTKDAITGFECLAEARQVEPQLAQDIIEHFKPQLDIPQTDDTLTRAFGSVAANDRGRGKSLFQFLAQTLQDSQSPSLRIAAAASALSKTNLPKAAEVLTQWYGDSEPIIKMGDLAVPSLAKLADKGKVQAVDDLCVIGTPSAVTTLVPLLWDEEISVSERSAYYLGAFISQTEIEEELQQYKLSPVQKSETESEALRWIWQPFNKTKTSSIEIITGRIAYHLLRPGFVSVNAQPITQQTHRLDPRLVIPLCMLQLRPAPLPQRLPSETESLLEQTDTSPSMEATCTLIVKEALSQQPSSKLYWVQLLSALPPKVQLDVLNRLIPQQKLTKNQWKNLNQIVNYNMREGWHYRTILTISALLSVVAIVQLLITAFDDPENFFTWFSIGPVIALMLIFWATLRQGIEHTSEPSLFLELGPWGLLTFVYQLTQLFERRIIWPGIESLFDSITDNRILGGVFIGAFVVAGAFAITDDGSAFTVFAFFIAFTFTSLGVFIGANVGVIGRYFTDACATAFSCSFTVAFFVAVTVAGTNDTDAVTVAYIENLNVIRTGAFAGAFTLTGIALNAWNRSKNRPREKWLHVLAIFAFPWFCWFPVTFYLSTLAIHNLLAKASSLTIPTWQPTTIVVATILTLCTALWYRGKYLEAKAQNPFQGGAVGAALGLKH